MNNKYVEDQDLAEDLVRERSADTLNIKKIKNSSDLNLYKNKIVAYLDDNLTYAQKKEVEAKLGESRELFAFYEQKKQWLDSIERSIPEAHASEIAIEQIEVELFELADSLFQDVKGPSVLDRLKNLF